MSTTGRRDFLKTMACATCLYGFSSFFRLAAQEPVNNANKSHAEKNEAFALHWITTLLESLDENNLTDNQLRAIVKKTSQAHHSMLNVPDMVKPYVGKPQDFVRFLQDTWGWKVKDDTANRMLIIDENKPFCVCPLLKNETGKLYPALCYCSEGFAEQMFSAVYEHAVTVTVAASVQRGDLSCVYHVNY